MEESYLGQNIYTREMADQALTIGHRVKSRVDNMFNIQKASSIEIEKLQEHINSKNQKIDTMIDDHFYQDPDFTNAIKQNSHLLKPDMAQM